MKQTISLQIIPSVLNFRLIIYLFTLILDCYNINEYFFDSWHTRCKILFSKLLITYSNLQKTSTIFAKEASHDKK